jgi:hypothetical protein
MTAILSMRAKSWTPPTRWAAAILAVKVALLRTRRAADDLARSTPRLNRASAPLTAPIAGESRTALWTEASAIEQPWQWGKVENLRVAARALDGLFIPADTTFSFWRHVGPPTALRGFVAGRMLREGCMVPATGGGLCQLSNALYDVALQAGCRIVERHAHSRVVPGSAAAEGRDATVAWNYVDLRFTCDRDLRLSVSLNADSLVVRLMGAQAIGIPPGPETAARASAPAPRSCGLCDETDCFRHARRAPAVETGRRVFLLDEAWPEFQDYVRAVRTGADRLGVPIKGGSTRFRRYAWSTDGFEVVGRAPGATLQRSLAQRMAGQQGAARRGAELAGARRIALSLARFLRPEVTSVVVAQSYLPFLWREGRLGGRAFTVLMTRLPMNVLQARLDGAADTHPERQTLSDFRAPAWLAEAESEALAAAMRIVTPHAEIAALFRERAHRIPWAIPSPSGSRPAPVGRFIVFPGPTVARKGAHAVRQAASALGLKVMALGSQLEGPDFWSGTRLVPPGDWLTALAVAQPAIVEDQPRRLLAALAAGVPVIATPACGLDPQPGLVLIPADDPAALIEALGRLVDEIPAA